MSAGEFIAYQKCGSLEHSVEPVTEEESRYRHSGWAHRRQKVWESLQRIGTGDTRLARFANCGSGLWLEVNSARDDIRLRCNKCHDRGCLPCQGERTGLISAKLTAKMQTVRTRFLTLTLRASQTPLCAQLDRLFRSFSVFRRRSDWRAHVKGGCAALECKIGSGSGLWHPHLHVVIEGSWWDQREISRAWHEITGDSSIVHIKDVTDPAQGAAYLTKYMTKPADPSVFNVPARLDELLLALKGRRLCIPFGTWLKLKLTAKPEPTDVWTPVASMRSLSGLAAPLSDDDRRWRDAAARKFPELVNLFGWSVDSS